MKFSTAMKMLHLANKNSIRTILIITTLKYVACECCIICRYAACRFTECRGAVVRIINNEQRVKAEKSCWRGRLCTVDLLVLTSFSRNTTPFYIESIIFCQTSNLNGEHRIINNEQRVKAEKSYWRGRLSTVNLLVLTSFSSDTTPSYIESIIFLPNKQP